MGQIARFAYDGETDSDTKSNYSFHITIYSSLKHRQVHGLTDLGINE